MTTSYIPDGAPVGLFENSYFYGWINDLVDFVRASAKVITVTAAYTITNNDFLVRVDCTSAGVTITLPPVANVRGKTCIVKKIDSSGNTLTLSGNGSDKIDGSGTKTTTIQYAIIRVISNGASWDVI